jgi:Zn finger protein HypA/HybF involved in hydrogenase expression
MNKTMDYYTERMGFWPSYGCPEQIQEDDEFVYFRFSVPRFYIRFMMEDGEPWHQYVETDEEGTLDSSCVLGVRQLPVFIGIQEEGSDADFVYYICPVPKRVMVEPVSGTDFTNEAMYYVVEKWERQYEEIPDDFEFEIDVPTAGTTMPKREELEAIRKAKKENILLYEVTFQCQECDEILEPEVSSDLFDALLEKACEHCESTHLKLVSSRAIVKEEDDG